MLFEFTFENVEKERERETEREGEREKGKDNIRIIIQDLYAKNKKNKISWIYAKNLFIETIDIEK